MLNFLFSGGNKTVRKSKGGSESDYSAASSRLIHLANSTLGSGNLKNAVSLPVGEDGNEWIAYNAYEFVNQIKLVYGVVSVLHCNEKSCPTMAAGSKIEFLWCDDVKYKRPTKLAASTYISLSLDQCQNLLDDEAIFPTLDDAEFPSHKGKFQTAVKTIFKRIFRIYAHLYHHHYQVFTDSTVESLLNTSFKHFIYFVKEFKILADQDLEPLSAMIRTL